MKRERHTSDFNTLFCHATIDGVRVMLAFADYGNCSITFGVIGENGYMVRDVTLADLVGTLAIWEMLGVDYSRCEYVRGSEGGVLDSYDTCFNF